MPRPISRALAGPGGRLVGVFVAASAAWFGIPAAFGNTWLVGDNLIQNFPLRVLVGTDIRNGHLPLWNPYLWSGTPLLAGFSAGAAYPTTLLFSILPGALAWVGNQVVVEVVAATGMMALLRVLGRSWTASGLGALSFAYGGFMAAQGVHLDLVQAAAWLPWTFVALDRLAHRPQGRPAAPWVALLGLSTGLMILAGATEPILDGAIALVIYGVWLLWRTPGRRLSLLIGSAAGLAVGLLTAGAQLVPGAFFQAQSQRAAHTYAYFASGSMNKSLTILGLDPLLLGGGHSFPLSYLGTYNLPELSSYIGILPVMGLFGLLARRHRRSPQAGTWWIWYAILLVALVITWGDFTPLGHLFYNIPLFNRQRLVNRNILVIDLALAVIFATWVDRMFMGADKDSPPADGGHHRRWRSDMVLPLVPAGAVVALQIVMLAGGTWFPHFLHVPAQVTRSSMWPLVAFLTIPSAIAVAASVVVIRRKAIGRHLPAVLAAIVVVDLAVFNVVIQVAPDPSAATSVTSASANALAGVVSAYGGRIDAGTVARLAIFNPDRFYPVETDRLGQPDLNILRALPSIQGYGALVYGGYDAATGTHTQLSMKSTELANGDLAQLDLGVLVSVPEYFVHLVGAPPNFTARITNGAVHIPPVGPSATSVPTHFGPLPPPTAPGDYSIVPAPASTLPVPADGVDTMYLGTVVSVTGVQLPLAASAPPGATVAVGVLAPSGRTTWIGSAPLTGTVVSFHLRRPTAASGIVLRSSVTGSGVYDAPVVRTAGQGTYRVDGSLRDIVTTPRWTFARMVGLFPAFTEPSSGPAWVVGGLGRATVVSSTPWGTQTIKVTASSSVTLIRDEAFDEGWQATISPGGPATVHRRALVQAVSVPAGTHDVTFFYQPHRVLEGFAATTAGLIALLGLVLWGPLTRRRRDRQGRQGESAPA